MRDDLLEAKACVDWAVSHFPSLENRFREWLTRHVRVIIKDPDPKVPNNLVIASEEEPLPLAFNIEVGAYINTIRTSLDILATSLARRYGVPHADQVYFPIAAGRTEFLSGNYKGSKFVKRLPDVPRDIIENLFPYKGGNETLWTLHDLDIKRKHRNLLAVEPHPATLSITGVNIDRDFFPVKGAGWVRANNETILGLISKSAPEPKIKFTPYIGFNEPMVTAVNSNVIRALCNFAGEANAIIKLFDAI